MPHVCARVCGGMTTKGDNRGHHEPIGARSGRGRREDKDDHMHDISKGKVIRAVLPTLRLVGMMCVDENDQREIDIV